MAREIYGFVSKMNNHSFDSSIIYTDDNENFEPIDDESTITDTGRCNSFIVKNLKYAAICANGEIKYELDPHDISKTIEGDIANVEVAQGEYVAVGIPKLYMKIQINDDGLTEVYFSNEQVDSQYLCMPEYLNNDGVESDYCYIPLSDYCCTVYDGLGSNKPILTISQITFMRLLRMLFLKEHN